MSAPKKNNFYLKRLKHGRDKIFETPESLKDACYQYFNDAIRHPLQEEKVFGTGLKMTVNRPRPFTLKGMFVYLSIDRKTWDNYRVREEYATAIEEIENVIYTNKLEGAAVGFFNANLMSRELGLADKLDIDYEKLSDDQVDQLFNKYVLKGNR